MCAKKTGYFSVLESQLGDEKRLKQLDVQFEKCLGKYTDSYESGLDVFNAHLKSQNKKNVITHK